MDQPIDIRFKLTEEEYVRAIRRHFINHPFVWVAGAFLVVSIGAAMWCASDNKPGPGVASWTLVGAGLGIYLFYSLLVSPSRAYHQLNRSVRESELNYRFTTTGIEVKTESFQGRWDWKLFGHFTEYTDAFLIFPKGRGNHMLLPKRAIGTAEGTAALRDLLKANLRVW